jgi:hypothetical protein
VQASSPGTHAEPQMVHALVHARQANCPSTRTGSTGGLAHIGQSSKIDAFQLPTED